MTLRNNILFEKPFDEDFYRSVLSACALEADIELLQGGEMTEIGEKVSGQKSSNVEQPIVTKWECVPVSGVVSVLFTDKATAKAIRFIMG